MHARNIQNKPNMLKKLPSKLSMEPNTKPMYIINKLRKWYGMEWSEVLMPTWYHPYNFWEMPKIMWSQCYGCSK